GSGVRQQRLSSVERKGRRAIVEAVEQRVLFATIIVNTFSDTFKRDDFTTLRESIVQAAPDDTIGVLGSLSGSINLTGGKLLISKRLTILGTPNNSITVSGN